ncbi:MAG: hypothetical protein HUU01_24215 [Saprospiraceae bacterium]|nr:hypothetical protein [Saprospiraceae bacterium]
MPDHLSNTGLFRNDHHLSEEGIAACAEALLAESTGDLPPQLQAHLESCEACRREVIELYGLISTMPPRDIENPDQDEATQPSSPRKPETRLHPGWRWSLVAMTALLAFWMYRSSQTTQLLLKPNQNVPTPIPEQLLNPQQKAERPIVETETPEQNPVKQPEQELYAANFVPSAELEGLTGEVLRSGGLEITSPTVNQTVKPGNEIFFQWKQDNSTPLQLIVLDNRGKELFRQEVSNGSYGWRTPQRPGLYYWKLESTEELLFTGKFLLR